ncbi:MAG: 16S rRNA (guanine(966)-N(2))-methyltransferase RsmD [Acidobacteria bacterium]|nr:16S rRNA (guanine(966)-N(2))-methyltransferase RsmD [Acidobacteriota bacterium]
MRIIAGECRGRRLKTLRGREVRPSSDKLRETLFNILRAEVPDSVFIDCYAGSGAVGLEASSRGAAQVFLIEQDAAAIRVMEQNITGLGLGGRARIVQADVKAGLRKLDTEGVCADICFLDPPYALLPAALRNLSWLCNSSLMHPEGIIILEHSRKDGSPEQLGGWHRGRFLTQGSSALSFYRIE